jgi:glutaredoxin
VRRLVLVGKPDCGLCDDLRQVAEAEAQALGLALEEVDVRDHPELEERYLFEIPVLLLGTREVARHRATREELRARLTQLLESPEP